jgi:hypothetical protein
VFLAISAEPKREKDRYYTLRDMQPQDGSLGNRIVLLFRLGMANTISGVREGRINAAKLLRACGGCLGARRR